MSEKKQLNKEKLEKVNGGYVVGKYYVIVSGREPSESGIHSIQETLGPYDDRQSSKNAGLLWATIHHLKGYTNLSYTTFTAGNGINHMGVTYYYPSV